jgi:N-acetylmuramoyl-L-alanine amidase
MKPKENISAPSSAFDRKAKTSGRKINFWGAAALAAITATSPLETASADPLPRERFSVSQGRVAMTPAPREGMQRMLHGVGMDTASGSAAFNTLNGLAFEEEQDLIRLGRNYLLPIQSVRINGSLLNAMRSRGLSASHLQRIHRFNQTYNPHYGNVSDPNRIPRGQVVWVPEWNSGFYDRSPAAPAAESRAIARRIVSGLPYPEMKRALMREQRTGDLSGMILVVDPGHGGDDPGSIETTPDGSRKQDGFAEAVAVHDISLRVVQGIIERGGIAYPTHYSKSMGITDANVRDLPPRVPDDTYNRGRAGRHNIVQDRAAASLATRRLVTRALIRDAEDTHGVDPKQSIFLSLHADSLPLHMRERRVRTVITDRRDRTTRFADTFARHFGASRRSQGLYVLQNNPARHEALVELGNVNNAADAWRLTTGEERQKISDEIVNALAATMREMGN